MGFISAIFGQKKEVVGVPILEANIRFDEKNNAEVELQKLHPDTPVFDYIKLALHITAKSLVLVDPDDDHNYYPVTEILLRGIKNIDIPVLNTRTNILKLFNVDDSTRFAKPKENIVTIKATLYAISGTVRHIVTDLPKNITVQQGTYMAPVTIQRVMEMLDEDNIEILKRSFRSMKKQYDYGYRLYSDLSKWESVPNKAFFEAFDS